MTEKTPKPIKFTPSQLATLVMACPYCLKPVAHGMAHRAPEWNDPMGMMATVAFPDATAITCPDCGKNYMVEFAKPVCRDCEGRKNAAGQPGNKPGRDDGDTKNGA